MHIPDGFLSTPVWASLNVATWPAVGYLARRAQKSLDEGKVPLLGVLGAFVFAAQMVNFPVGVGTSGHLVGSALLTFTLGPAAAAVVMTAILALQALIFQDGGLLALAANVFNMAIIGVLAAYLPFHYWGSGRWRKAAIFLGGFLSLFVGACLALSQLLLSGVQMPGTVLGASLGIFVVTAALEGAITLAVLQAMEALNPGWVREPAKSARRALGALAAGALLLACIGVLFASADPDGLEKLAEEIGIAEHARNLMTTPLTDYEVSFLGSTWLSKATAGLIGLILIVALCLVVGRLLARRRSA